MLRIERKWKFYPATIICDNEAVFAVLHRITLFLAGIKYHGGAGFCLENYYALNRRWAWPAGTSWKYTEHATKVMLLFSIFLFSNLWNFDSQVKFHILIGYLRRYWSFIIQHGPKVFFTPKSPNYSIYLVNLICIPW